MHSHEFDGIRCRADDDPPTDQRELSRRHPRDVARDGRVEDLQPSIVDSRERAGFRRHTPDLRAHGLGGQRPVHFAIGEAELQQLGNNVYLWRSFDSSGAMTGVADSAWPR